MFDEWEERDAATSHVKTSHICTEERWPLHAHYMQVLKSGGRRYMHTSIYNHECVWLKFAHRRSVWTMNAAPE